MSHDEDFHFCVQDALSVKMIQIYICVVTDIAQNQSRYTNRVVTHTEHNLCLMKRIILV